MVDGLVHHCELGPEWLDEIQLGVHTDYFALGLIILHEALPPTLMG